MLLGGGLGPDEKAALDRGVLGAYEAVGVTADPRTHSRPAPTLVGLAEALRADAEPAAASLANRLAPFTRGSHRGLFDGPTTLRPEGHLVVLSLRDLPDELKAAGTLLTLDAVWRAIAGAAPPRRRLVVVDEAWLLMREPEGARFLFRMAKSARKRWCGLTVVTQDAADLLGSPLGQAVVANAATQVLLRQAPQAIGWPSRPSRAASSTRLAPRTRPSWRRPRNPTSNDLSERRRSMPPRAAPPPFPPAGSLARYLGPTRARRPPSSPATSSTSPRPRHPTPYPQSPAPPWQPSPSWLHAGARRHASPAAAGPCASSLRPRSTPTARPRSGPTWSPCSALPGGASSVPSRTSPSRSPPRSAGSALASACPPPSRQALWSGRSRPPGPGRAPRRARLAAVASAGGGYRRAAVPS